MENKKHSAPHVLVLPNPSQSHINPMLQFCKRLSFYGLKTTFATTLFISKTFNPTLFPSIEFDTISDGFDDGGFAHAASVADYLSRMEAAGSKTLAELINRHKNTSNPIDCVVYDPILQWALDVAKRLGIAGAAFFTQACTVSYVYYCVYHAVLKLPISSFPLAVDGLQFLLRRLEDMPSFITVDGSYPAYFEMVLNQFSNTHEADFVFFNSVYEWEEELVNSMSKVCRVLTIGPAIPSIYLDNSIKDDKEYGFNLITSDSSLATANWLNSKPPHSVVYVSFGSISCLSAKQMEELALGLKATNLFILWVVRSSEEPKLPHNFAQEMIMSEKGLIVNWSSQVEVLSHPAVGCFFSHCGWNSTVEALSLGVPMVGMPQWTDQPTNAKLVEDLWKVGVRVKVDEDGIVGRKEVEFCIREVMEGNRAAEIRRNAKKWRNLALQAISEGGSSDNNIREFISKLIKT